MFQHIFAIFMSMLYLFESVFIVSGGQTGVDRAALDFALLNNIPCGGFCTKGRRAEDGRISTHYPLQELQSTSFAERTLQNILNSDVTLILYQDTLDRGTKLTLELCITHKKSSFCFSLKKGNDILNIHSWLLDNKVKKLNIAGPRESNSPGIYDATLHFLNKLNQT